jgi:hypothetical protein
LPKTPLDADKVSTAPVNSQLINKDFLKHKRRKTFWLISTLISGGAGTYAYLQSNKLYNDYKTATTDAASIRSKIKTLDIAYPVAYGIAGFSMIEFIIQAGKQSKEKKVSLSLEPYANGGGINLAFTF